MGASARVGQLGATAFAVVTCAARPHAWVVAWAVVAAVIHAMAPVGARAWRADPVRDQRVWQRRMDLLALSIGIVWGLGLTTAVLTSEDLIVRMSATTFALGVSSAGTNFTAAGKRDFWLMNGTILLPLGVVEIATGDTVFVALGLSVLMYLGFAWVMHRQANVDLVGSLTGRLHLEHLALHDPLTGLPNRTAMALALDTALLAATERVGVLHVDLDRFKVVNDSLGHDAGDQLVIELARRYRPLVEPAGTLYRVGGDELIVLTTAADDATIRAMAEQLRDALAAPIRVHERDLQVTASIGIAIGPSPGDTGQDLLRHADAALYRAKDRGRNRVEMFDDALRARLRRRIDDEVEIRGALDRGEIEPWYQPIVDLRTGAIVGAEALARWRHPTRGVLPAGAFISIVEESGLTGKLTDQIVERVVADLTRWRAAGVPTVRVKVNLGAELFARANLAQWLSDLMRAHDCPADAIGVEVTETNLLQDIPLAAEHLRQMRANGITVALDDFGTAWSSLALLRQLPLDTVKVDRMFVIGLPDGRQDRALISAVVGIARDLDLDVVAEGVETRAQADAAAALGCEMAQGWLYSPAVGGDKLVELLVRRPFEDTALSAVG